jgi:hypothetical protein
VLFSSCSSNFSSITECNPCLGTAGHFLKHVKWYDQLCYLWSTEGVQVSPINS